MSSPTQGCGSCWLLPLEKHVLVLGKKEGKIAWPLTSFFPQEGPQVLKRMNGSSIRAALPWHHHRIRNPLPLSLVRSSLPLAQSLAKPCHFRVLQQPCSTGEELVLVGRCTETSNPPSILYLLASKYPLYLLPIGGLENHICMAGRTRAHQL